MIYLEYLVLALASFRLQRVMTKDTWPVSEWFRNRVKDHWLSRKKDSFSRRAWQEFFDFIHCPWCFGFWTCVAVFCEHHYLTVVPMWLYATFAASGVVGLLGTYDERDN